MPCECASCQNQRGKSADGCRSRPPDLAGCLGLARPHDGGDQRPAVLVDDGGLNHSPTEMRPPTEPPISTTKIPIIRVRITVPSSFARSSPPGAVDGATSVPAGRMPPIPVVGNTRGNTRGNASARYPRAVRGPDHAIGVVKNSHPRRGVPIIDPPSRHRPRRRPARRGACRRDPLSAPSPHCRHLLPSCAATDAYRNGRARRRISRNDLRDEPS